jgi:hypothetical protein
MATNLIAQEVEGYGPEPRVAWMSFAPNGASNPVVTSSNGPRGIKNATITYSATGVYTIVFSSDFQPPSDAVFVVGAQCAALASYFEAVQLGAYNATTRTLVVQAKQGASGVAVAAAAGARIHIQICFNDSTGA